VPPGPRARWPGGRARARARLTGRDRPDRWVGIDRTDGSGSSGLTGRGPSRYGRVSRSRADRPQAHVVRMRPPTPPHRRRLGARGSGRPKGRGRDGPLRRGAETVLLRPADGSAGVRLDARAAGADRAAALAAVPAGPPRRPRPGRCPRGARPDGCRGGGGPRACPMGSRDRRRPRRPTHRGARAARRAARRGTRARARARARGAVDLPRRTPVPRGPRDAQADGTQRPGRLRRRVRAAARRLPRAARDQGHPCGRGADAAGRASPDRAPGGHPDLDDGTGRPPRPRGRPAVAAARRRRRPAARGVHRAAARTRAGR
jgi:hypothetical protein